MPKPSGTSRAYKLLADNRAFQTLMEELAQVIQIEKDAFFDLEDEAEQATQRLKVKHYQEFFDEAKLRVKKASA